MMNRYVSRMNRQQARDQKHGRIRIPFNLQLFAEDGADGGDDGSDDGDDGSDDGDDDRSDEPEKKYTDAFEAVLTELGIPFQAEGPFPKRLTKHELPREKTHSACFLRKKAGQ